MQWATTAATFSWQTPGQRLRKVARERGRHRSPVGKGHGNSGRSRKGKAAAAKKSWPVQWLLPRCQRSAADSGTSFYKICWMRLCSVTTTFLHQQRIQMLNPHSISPSDSCCCRHYRCFTCMVKKECVQSLGREGTEQTKNNRVTAPQHLRRISFARRCANDKRETGLDLALSRGHMNGY